MSLQNTYLLHYRWELVGFRFSLFPISLIPLKSLT